MAPRTGKTTLSHAERIFLIEYFQNGGNARAAYAVLRPDVAEATCYTMGSKLLARIKKKVVWADILASAGLDDFRLARELDARLRAMKSEFYKGDEVAETEDNATRMRATELLSELLGHKRESLDLTIGGPPKVITIDLTDDQTDTGDAAAVAGEDALPGGEGGPG